MNDNNENASVERISAFFKDIYDSVNMWLHFAEAKNAALIAVNIAILSLLLGTDMFLTHSILAAIICVLLCISSLICLLSFWPITKKFLIPSTNNHNTSPNLLFYGDIASFNFNDYVDKIYNTYFSSNSNMTEQNLHLDYAKEIIENSKITIYKLKLFKYAVFSDLFAVLLFIILIVCA